MRDAMRRTWILARLVLLTAALAGCAEAATQRPATDQATAPEPAAAPEVAAATPSVRRPGILTVRSYALNTFKRELDGQWQGIRVASDGNVYFASSSHSACHGAAFFRYDTKSRDVTMLCREITEICGEDPKKTPQNKIHSDIVEAHGWLYFATHFSGGGPGAAGRYPGSHVIGYEIASGTFRDLGIVHPNYTVYSGIAVDPQRRRLTVFTTPITDEGARDGGGSHIYRIDVATGKKQDLGVVKPGKWGHCFWLFVDRRGDCWFTLHGTGGALFCARAETGRIERYENALPKLCRWDRDEELHDPGVQQSRWWRWSQPLGDGDRCVFSMAGGGRLWLFDATKDIPSGAAFRKVAHIGAGDLGMALGGGRVYYVQRAGRNPRPKANDHHLRSVSLDPKADPAIVDHGLILDQDGRTPWRIPSLAADAEGHVYMVGDWRLNKGEKGTLRYGYRGGKDTWRELWRGQFFAVADVSDADVAVRR